MQYPTPVPEGRPALTSDDRPEVPLTQRTPAMLDFPTGPAIGDVFPRFALMNQRDELVDLEIARAGRPAIVVFERSARW